jgi:hypothetical protein
VMTAGIAPSENTVIALPSYRQLFHISPQFGNFMLQPLLLLHRRFVEPFSRIATHDTRTNLRRRHDQPKLSGCHDTRGPVPSLVAPVAGPGLLNANDVMPTQSARHIFEIFHLGLLKTGGYQAKCLAIQEPPAYFMEGMRMCDICMEMVSLSC